MSIKTDAGKWGLIALVWGILAAVVLGGLWFFRSRSQDSLQEDTGSESQYKYEVRVAGDSFSGYCLLRSEPFKTALKQENIRLVYSDDGADYRARFQALHDGDVDMAPFPVNSLVELCHTLTMSPATIILFLDETRGADAMVAYKTAIKTLDDLNKADVRCVLTPGSPSEYLARVVTSDLDMSNLPKKWIIKADGAEDVYKRFKKASKSKPAAYVLWEPYISKALKIPDAHVVFGSDKIKGHIVDALVVRRKFLTEQPEVVKAFVSAYLKVTYAYSDPAKMQELVRRDAKAAGQSLSSDEARSIVAGIQWKNTLENYAHFRLLARQESQGLDDVEDIIEKITKVLKITGVVSDSSVEAHTLFYNKTLEDLQADGFHPKKKIGIIQGAAVDLDAIRADKALPALSDRQWGQLMAVGKMRVETLSFGRGTAQLNIQSRRYLEELAVKLKSMPLYYLSVVGHARAEGDPAANLQLATDRAKTATEYLVQRQGISRNRIKAVAAAPSDEGGSAQSVSFELMQRAY